MTRSCSTAPTAGSKTFTQTKATPGTAAPACAASSSTSPPSDTWHLTVGDAPRNKHERTFADVLQRLSHRRFADTYRNPGLRAGSPRPGNHPWMDFRIDPLSFLAGQARVNTISTRIGSRRVERRVFPPKRVPPQRRHPARSTRFSEGGRSSAYSTDVGKTFQSLDFHVGFASGSKPMTVREEQRGLAAA